MDLRILAETLLRLGGEITRLQIPVTTRTVKEIQELYD
jgi:hypothetical protein